MTLILQFMRICISKKEIPLSWGISNIIVTNTTISFNVFGSKKQTKITIEEIGNELIVKTDYIEMCFSNAIMALIWLDNEIE